MTLAVVLLAAGLSRRFGAEDKLRADLAGLPMITRTARICTRIGADHALAVLRDPDNARHLPREFEVAFCAGRMSDSLRCAAGFARAKRASRLIVMLADMPFVSLQSLIAVARLCHADAPSCLEGPQGLSPPACFPADWFARLEALRGDQGARVLLLADPLTQRIACPPEQLRDIDTGCDLAACLPRVATMNG